jgi:hypothetical protein
MNSLKKENKRLNKKLDELQPPVCRCPCVGQPAANYDQSSSSPANIDDTAAAGHNGETSVKRVACADADSSESSSSDSQESTDSESNQTEQSKKRKKAKHHKNHAVTKVPKNQIVQPSPKTTLRSAGQCTEISNQSSLKAAGAPVTKEVYIGNVDPDHTAEDIVAHIKQNIGITTLSRKDVRVLYTGQDAKSFCVSTAENDFNKILNASWTSGIKVRQFYPRSGKGRSSRNGKPQRRWRGGDSKHISQSPRYHYNQYGEQPFRAYPRFQYHSEHDYDEEWPRLPRSSWNHEGQNFYHY